MGRIKLKPLSGYMKRRTLMDKYVTVPPKVRAYTPSGEPYTNDGKDIGEYDMHRYLMMFIVNEETVEPRQGMQPKVTPKMGVGHEGNRRVARLDKDFRRGEKCVGGCYFHQHGDAPHELCVVKVTGEDWDAVTKAIRERDWSPKHFGSQFVTIEDAWCFALEKAPTIEKPAPAGDPPTK